MFQRPSNAKATFDDVVRFVKNEASIVNSSYGQVFNFGKLKEKTAKVNVHSTAMDDVTGKVYKRVNCRLCSKQQSLTECGLFKRKSVAVFLRLFRSVVLQLPQAGSHLETMLSGEQLQCERLSKEAPRLASSRSRVERRGERQKAQRQTRNRATQVTTEEASSSPGIS